MSREVLNVKFKRVHEAAVIPSRANKTDVGLDLTAVSIRHVDDPEEGTYYEYDTGLQLAIPEGYGGFLFPRSSISKKDLILANAVGVLDPDYRGNIKLRYKYRINPKIYDIGDRIGQLVILPFPEVNLIEVSELPYGERGDNGFGSSDKVETNK